MSISVAAQLLHQHLRHVHRDFLHQQLAHTRIVHHDRTLPSALAIICPTEEDRRCAAL
jgi:hypothetical protein